MSFRNPAMYLAWNPFFSPAATHSRPPQPPPGRAVQSTPSKTILISITAMIIILLCVDQQGSHYTNMMLLLCLLVVCTTAWNNTHQPRDHVIDIERGNVNIGDSTNSLRNIVTFRTILSGTEDETQRSDELPPAYCQTTEKPQNFINAEEPPPSYDSLFAQTPHINDASN